MFEESMGDNQGLIVDDPVTRKGIDLWRERVLAFYGQDGGVDVEVMDDHLILNEKTQAHIYSGFTPTQIEYQKGSRLLLERVVAGNTTPEMDQRNKALGLMRRCRDNRDYGLASPDLFKGGNEEELLKRGAIQCNEISRVYACLCQIAGLRCRLFSSHISGHMMNEVEVDGQWWWIDVMKGMFAVDGHGQPVSAWELKQDPTLFERQPAWVVAECRPPSVVFGDHEKDPGNIAYCFARPRDCYFHPREATAVANYPAGNPGRYTYPWRKEAHDLNKLGEIREKEQNNRKDGGWPDYCRDPKTFDPACISVSVS